MPVSIGSDYYSGRTLLITGATGLVGKVLLEAILRKLPQVNRIYVLIRKRTGPGGRLLTPDEVLKGEILESSAFENLRTRLGACFDELAGNRVAAVEGDLSEDRLGLSARDYERLAREVDVVINSGALAVFDAPLDEAFQTNTLGPRRLLDFAREGIKRPFLAHISTCYVNNTTGPIFETPLDPTATPRGRSVAKPFDVDQEVTAIQERLAGIGNGHDVRERLVEEGLRWARRRGWNDTYTLTKAMGEQLFARHQGEVRGLILRPSIIESSLRTPAPGWIDGLRMADPLIIGYARRQVFDFPGHPEAVLDVVPVDVVVDALLMAIPWTHSGRGPRVYQVASGMDHPLFLKDFRVYLRDYYEKAPLRREGVAGENNLPLLSYPDLKSFLRDLDYGRLLPLKLQEIFFAPFRGTSWGKQRYSDANSRRSRIERLRNTAAIYGPYTETQSRFLTFNVRSMWAGLSPEDRARFPFLLQEMDWRRYLQEIHLPGIERYLLRMPRSRNAPAVPPESWVKTVEVFAETKRQDGEGLPKWEKAERLLSNTKAITADEAHAWTTPLYKKVIHRTGLRLVRLVCHRRLELEAFGTEAIPERGPFIVVANHTSHVDTGVLLAALAPFAEQVHPTAAADYWFRSPLTAWLLHATLGAIPFDRHSRNIPKALSLPTQILRNGHSLIFYPEGSRSPDGELHPFRSTVGLLALASGAPIVPAHILGASAALAKGDSFIRHAKVRVRFGPAIRIESYLGQLDRQSVAHVARQIASDAHSSVRRLKQESQIAGEEEGVVPGEISRNSWSLPRKRGRVSTRRASTEKKG